jgi:Outer membrane protein beta-barrel domain
MRMLAGAVGPLALLFASTAAGAEVHVGVLAGVNVARLHFSEEDPDLDLRSKTFLATGAVVEVALTRGLSLQLEPMYIQKGGRLEIRDFFGEDASASLRFSYIELPALLKYAKATGPVRPYLIAGPSVAYRVGGVTLRDEATGEEEEPEDADENIGKWDVGLGAGGGLQFPVGRSTLFVEARYTWGLSNINEEDEEFQIKNRGVQVLLGVAIPIRGH